MAKSGFFKHNGLSLTMLALFLIFWVGQGVSGYFQENEEREDHHRPPITALAYVGSAHFWEATTENWESEFLQMGVFTVLTTFLFQKGSAESRDPDEKKPSGAGGTPWQPATEPEKTDKPKRRKGTGSRLYAHSLSIALFALFFACWAGHAVSGWAQYNVEQAQNNAPTIPWSSFLVKPDFWFQSLQNWQSEFLAIFSMVVLTIFLREEGSSQSKDVESPNDKTGSDD